MSEVELVQRPVIQVDTEVSQYERVSGGLTSGVIILGLVAIVVFAIWYSLLESDRVVVTAIPALAGETSNPEGVAEDIEEPGVEEFPEVQEPMVAEALEAVDVASTVRANDSVAGDAPFMGKGKGLGDSREQGFGNGGTDKSEPWKRWEINFKVTTLADYKQQLDDLGIQLGGAEKRGDTVVYVSNFTGNMKRSDGLKRSEKRIFFQHSKIQLRNWDLSILQEAGVQDAGDRMPVQFYPNELINKIYSLEATRMQSDGRKAVQIKKTKFNIVGSAGNYDIDIDTIEYLN